MTQPTPYLQADLDEAYRLANDGKVEEAILKLAIITLDVRPSHDLARSIGNLYWSLDYKAMAGRYWYLLDNKTEEMLTACEEFERAHGNSPELILNAVGDYPPDSPELKAVFENAKTFRACYRPHSKPSDPGFVVKYAGLSGCGVIILALMMIFSAGVNAIWKQFSQW